MKMQAALWYGPEDLRLEEIDLPKIGPDEVLVKIGAALTCGTDFKLFRRGHPILARVCPAPFGHEMAGTIVETGKKAAQFRVGDRVVAANSAPCGSCFFCQRDQQNLCEDLEFLTGAYAEYIRIPARIVERNLYQIPEDLPFHEAGATEPLACALHCFDKAAVQPQESLCLIGAGPCALLFVQLARLKGIRTIVVGRGSEKLNLAKRLGAGETVSVLEENYTGKIRELTQRGRGPDVVIEGAGLPEAWELATQLVRKGGRVWFYGGCAKGSTIALDTHRIHYDEISMSGVFHHTPRYFRQALDLISTGQVQIGPLIAAKRRLTELGQVFQKGRAENPLKVAIIP